MSQILRYIRSLFPFLIFNFERLIFCPQDKSGYILCNVNYCFISGHREPFSALLLFLSLSVSIFFLYINVKLMCFIATDEFLCTL